jgi:hypothetical protein
MVRQADEHTRTGALMAAMRADDLGIGRIEITNRDRAFVLHQRSFRITIRLSVSGAR